MGRAVSLFRFRINPLPPIGTGGGGGGVQSVTGDGVGGTAVDPVMTFPTPAQIGAKADFSENTAFNKDFGTTAGTVLEGNTPIGGGEDFSATLAIGNTTGGNDVSVSAGDAILLEDSNISYQSINFPGLGDTALVFGNNGGVSGGYLFADDITGDYTHISKSGALHLKATIPQVTLQIGGNTTTIGTLALTGSRTINFQNASGTLAFLSDIPSSVQKASCCPFGAKSDGTGKFLIANGKSSDADDSSKDKTRQPIPYTGTIVALVYKTKEADSTTQMKIHVNGVVEATVSLTNINADNGGIEVVSISVTAGDYVEIEYDANQKPGECTMSLNMEIA